MKSPCRECEQKGCGSFHDSCEKYQEWRKWLDAVNQMRYEESQMRSISADHENKYRRVLMKGKLKP